MEGVIIVILICCIFFSEYNGIRRSYVALNKNLNNAMIQVKIHLLCAHDIINKLLESIKADNYDEWKKIYKILQNRQSID